MVFPNLEAELSRNGLRRKDLAPVFNNRISTVSDKLNGKYPISLDEAFKIKNQFFPQLEIEYLFCKAPLIRGEDK